MGGEYGGDDTSNFYSTSQYEPKWAPIIINGVMYYTNLPRKLINPSRLDSTKPENRTKQSGQPTPQTY